MQQRKRCSVLKSWQADQFLFFSTVENKLFIIVQGNTKNLCEPSSLWKNAHEDNHIEEDKKHDRKHKPDPAVTRTT